jgi:Ferritin-like domain
VVELLNQQLADALDLALQAKQAHWNVKGPSFIALHELFDSVVEEIVEHADDLAERAVELGGTSGAFGPRPTRHACPAPGVNTSRRSRRPSPGSVPRPERESMPRPGWATLAQFQRLEREADL